MTKRTDTDGPGTDVILLTAAAFMLLTVGISSTAWWIAGRPDEEWPAWIEAGATVAAVGAAVAAGFYAARAFGLEFKREQRWEDAQLSAQASLVAAWPSSEPWTMEEPLVTYVYGGRATLRNASQLPVSDVVVDYWVVAIDEHSELLPVLLGSSRRAYLAPSQGSLEVDFGLDDHRDGIAVTEEVAQHLELVLEVTFRDAAGVRWQRTRFGQLVATSSRWS